MAKNLERGCYVLFGSSYCLHVYRASMTINPYPTNVENRVSS